MPLGEKIGGLTCSTINIGSQCSILRKQDFSETSLQEQCFSFIEQFFASSREVLASKYITIEIKNSN